MHDNRSWCTPTERIVKHGRMVIELALSGNNPLITEDIRADFDKIDEVMGSVERFPQGRMVGDANAEFRWWMEGDHSMPLSPYAAPGGHVKMPASRQA